MYVITNDSMKGDELRLMDVEIVPLTELKLTPVKDTTNVDAPTFTPASSTITV